MLTKVIASIGYVVLAINLLLYYKAYFLNKNKVIKLFTYYLAITLVIQFSTKTLHYFKIPNLFLSHIYFMSQFICLSFFYKLLLFNGKNQVYVKYIVIIVIILVGSSFVVDTSLLLRFNLFEIITTSVPLITYSILLLFKLISIKSNAFIYLNIGVLFYLLLSTLIFLSGNLINNLPGLYNTITWLVNVTLYLLFQLLIFYEWYRNLRHKRENIELN